MSLPHLQSRRHFIRTSSALLVLPWLESLAGAAEAAAPPRRMVNVCTSFGLYGPSFFPEKAGRDYVPSEYLEILGNLRDRFTVFSGISHPEIGGDHASEACFLTSAKRPTVAGFRNTVSLDYLAAKHAGSATRFPLLSLSTQDGGTRSPTRPPAPACPPFTSPPIFSRACFSPAARRTWTMKWPGSSAAKACSIAWPTVSPRSRHGSACATSNRSPTTPTPCATWKNSSRPTKPGSRGPNR